MTNPVVETKTSKTPVQVQDQPQGQVSKPSTPNANNPLPEKGKAVAVGFSGTLKRIDS